MARVEPRAEFETVVERRRFEAVGDRVDVDRGRRDAESELGVERPDEVPVAPQQQLGLDFEHRAERAEVDAIAARGLLDAVAVQLEADADRHHEVLALGAEREVAEQRCRARLGGREAGVGEQVVLAAHGFEPQATADAGVADALESEAQVGGAGLAVEQRLVGAVFVAAAGERQVEAERRQLRTLLRPQRRGCRDRGEDSRRDGVHRRMVTTEGGQRVASARRALAGASAARLTGCRGCPTAGW